MFNWNYVYNRCPNFKYIATAINYFFKAFIFISVGITLVFCIGELYVRVFKVKDTSKIYFLYLDKKSTFPDMYQPEKFNV